MSAVPRRAHCPNCGDEHGPRDRTLGRVKCFRCDYRRDTGKAEPVAATKPRDPEADERNWKAPRILAESSPIAGTIAERYLAGRGIGVDSMPDRHPLRFHPRIYHCIEKRALPAMVAPVVHVQTGKLITLHLTFIAPDGSGKAPVDRPRLFLGMRGRGVVKLTPDEDVTTGLAIAEGIETALSSPFRPIWACLDAGTLETFPLLAGIECLSVFADHDANGIGKEAALAAGRRWRKAGREIDLLMPKCIGDFNDLLGSGESR